jgi:predicted Zn-dependent peptidase
MMRRKGWRAALLIVAFLMATVGPVESENLAPGVYRFVLPNKLQLVVAVRPEVQLAAVNLTVNLGSIDDPPEQSGIAHMLEHATLSGSINVGTLNPKAEAAALAELDRAYRALVRERRKAEPEAAVLVGLERWFEQAHQAAQRTAESGEILGGRLESRGAIGLNATTTADATQFFTWIPTNDLDLWFSLEAERLRHPIFRRFYSEQNVVLREVAMLTGGRPTLQQRFLQELFPGAPSAQSLAGDPDQISALDRPTALAYFHRYYRPDNMVIAVAGNVDPEQVHRICLRYFGDWQPDKIAATTRARRPLPATISSPHVRNFNSVQHPVVFMAFPQPVESAAAAALVEMINSDELSPLRLRLVQERSLAWSVGAVANYPSQKQSAVFLVHVYGNSGVPHKRLVQEATLLLKSLSSSSDKDIEGGILAAEMHLAAQLEDLPTLASLLGFHQAVQGDWSVPFQQLEKLRRLKAEEVRLAARQLFDGLPSANVSLAGR